MNSNPTVNTTTEIQNHGDPSSSILSIWRLDKGLQILRLNLNEDVIWIIRKSYKNTQAILNGSLYP